MGWILELIPIFQTLHRRQLARIDSPFSTSQISDIKSHQLPGKKIPSTNNLSQPKASTSIILPFHELRGKRPSFLFYGTIHVTRISRSEIQVTEEQSKQSVQANAVARAETNKPPSPRASRAGVVHRIVERTNKTPHRSTATLLRCHASTRSTPGRRNWLEEKNSAGVESDFLPDF
jgi:hypothetical protein